MATEAQIIEHLREMSQYRERPECDDDGMAYYSGCGNAILRHLGGINLAKALIDALDNGADMPDLPPSDEDEDE